MTGKVPILIVEDDVGTCKLIEKRLQTSGLATESVHSGAEAIALCRKNQKRFLILDYQLQDMTAQKIITILAAEEIFPPFVIMTGLGNERVAVEMMRLGAIDYIVKDFNFIDLLPSLIERALDRLKIDEKLRRSEKEFRSLFENMQTAAVYFKVLTDENGQPENLVYIRVNKAFEWLTGLRGQDVLGENITEIFRDIHQLTFNWIQNLGRVAISGEGYSFEQYFEPLAIWVSGSAYRPETDHCAVIFSDITQLKLNEINLNWAKKELERKNKELEAFIYTAGHDLRTPLASAHGFFQLVQRRVLDKLSDNEKEMMARVTSGLSRLDSLLKDLLAFSQMDVRAEHQGAVPLGPIIERIVEEERQMIQFTDASITVEDNLPDIIIHPTHCYQLFKNLISNSLKYAKVNVPMKIEIGLSREHFEGVDGNYRVFTIKDNGIGIAKEIQDWIFGLFVRDEGMIKGGSGVGLAIAKRIVDLEEGRIWVESTIGEGSVFYFSLPVSD